MVDDTPHAPPIPAGAARTWTFLTNHAHVLLVITRDPTARLRDVAHTVGVTERAVHAIVADLEAGGYLHRMKVGRRNHYTVNPSGHFRHPAEADQRIGDFLALFGADTPPASSVPVPVTPASSVPVPVTPVTARADGDEPSPALR
ncbi:MAG: MarR family winged helix-turn-helix transcriptional regulator [Dactylosporangium sp.]|nr:MarR family winged helix-turn-helix transcriptional regulator [Dactylosporangium sp.]